MEAINLPAAGGPASSTVLPLKEMVEQEAAGVDETAAVATEVWRRIAKMVRACSATGGEDP